ncbi:PREDICTED: uncharacterized protein LOC100638254 [Amphimedon queenslandica]|uniref:Large ribosomal subunit protein bL20c n=1 Tax=Amphimedon queenslandica TaxID=400682 RepID=A0A1X7V7I7_AMPQE|nr:PREDICTED: uncharacterized protein LOC100638254 [Amphimedon queenslandica]|eukprot:XP_003385334.1 PREDICTED: uncharacterized protein LOC100638254 [Amphimedon queenslandica]
MVREGYPNRGTKRAKVFAITKGFRGRANNCYSLAVRAAQKALQHAYKGRKQKKRDMRSMWIQRINLGSREHGMPYNYLMNGLAKSSIQLNRKVLSEIAVHEPRTFKALVDIAQFSCGRQPMRSYHKRTTPQATASVPPQNPELYKTRTVLANDGKRLVKETDV